MPRKCDFQKLSLEAIHKIIKENKSKPLRELFNADEQTVKMHVSKARYQGKPLTISKLYDLTAEQLIADDANAFKNPINTESISLSSRSCDDIYDAATLFDNVIDAAAYLGVTYETLRVHLAKTLYNDQRLTFIKFRGLSRADLQKEYDLDEGLPTTAKSLKEHTLAEIHRIILDQKNAHNFITDDQIFEQLGVSKRTLAAHLAKLKYEDTVLTIEQLVSSSIIEMNAYYNEYQQCIIHQKVSYKNFNFNLIHEAILRLKDKKQVANFFGTTIPVFETNLSKTDFQGAPFTFDRLLGLTPQMLIDDYEDYYKPINTNVVLLKEKKFNIIHSTIRTCESIPQAAKSLGVSSKAIYRYLAGIKYNDELLTPERLGNLTAEELQAEWGQKYLEPMNSSQVPFNQLSLAYIHNIIKKFENISEENGVIVRSGV